MISFTGPVVTAKSGPESIRTPHSLKEFARKEANRRLGLFRGLRKSQLVEECGKLGISDEGSESQLRERATKALARDLGTLNQQPPNLGKDAVDTRLRFNCDPLYKIIAKISNVQVLRPLPTLTNLLPQSTFTLSLRPEDHPSLQRSLKDKRYRIMLFCADSNVGNQDVVFPLHAELHMNQCELPVNLRGLANKPESIRPVDITDTLHSQHEQANILEFKYMPKKKTFFLVVYLCKMTPMKDLVTQIAARSKISACPMKEPASTDSEDEDEEEDQGLIMTSETLSLECPISCKRIDVPCRGRRCAHMRCFDATSYLQLQEQSSVWVCPICNKSVPFDELAVVEDVENILQENPNSVTITINRSAYDMSGNNTTQRAKLPSAIDEEHRPRERLPPPNEKNRLKRSSMGPRFSSKRAKY